MVAGMIGMSTSIASVGTFRTTGDVNLRSEPSTDASVVTVVYNNSNVEVLEHDPAGWSRVSAGGSTGYIRSDFLKFPITNYANFRVTGGVNVRASASTDSRILDTVVAGTTVEVTEHNPAGWSKVRVNGNSGFIRSDFLARGDTGGSSGGGSGSGSGDSSSGASGTTMRTNGSVNLRSGSSTNASVIRTLAGRTSVQVTGQVTGQDGHNWSQVIHNGTEGFIRSDLLSDGGTASGATTLRTNGTVNLRSGSSTSSSVIRSLAGRTSVEVTGQVTGQDGRNWSQVIHNGTAGFIRSDLLSEDGRASGSTEMRTIAAGVRLRSGASTSHRIIRSLEINTTVTVLENLSNGWSRVRHNNTEGFIRSDLLGVGGIRVELIDWATARTLVPIRVNLDITDVRTGIRFQLRGFSRSGHMDVETPTRADTEAILRTRGGVWAWAPRPVWVTTGGRTFAAALNGMPHDVSTIRDNGMNGHLCLHFDNTVTNSKSYQRNLRNAVAEAYNARPR